MTPRTPLLALLLATALLPASTACVTRGSYKKIATERERLAVKNQLLEQQIQGLLKEQAALHDRNDELEKRVGTLKTANTQLGDQLVAAEAATGQLQGTYDSLVADLEKELASGQVEISQLRDGIRLNVESQVLFPSGSAELGAEGRKVLSKVVKELEASGRVIEVEGHTDDEAIGPSLKRRYPSNWELAGARAASVVRMLEEQGIDPAKLRAISFGQYHPLVSNDTAAGRRRNRRIEIRVVPE